MKTQTPMSLMKKEIDQMKEFSLLNFFSLNGRPQKVVALGSEDCREVLVAGAITFDYMAIFGLVGDICRTEKGHPRHTQSMAVCINYKDEQTVRASVVLSSEGNIEYSKEYTVPEFRAHLKEFVANNITCTDRKVLLDNYITAFGIVISASLSKAELNKIKEGYVKVTVELNNTMRRAQRAQGDARKAIRESQTETEKSIHIQRLKDLIAVAEKASADIVKMVKHDFKNMPAISRNHFFEELRKERIYY